MSSATPAKILAVDDIESNLVVLEALLQDPDLTIVRARSGREAIEALRTGEFSMVLLDVQMPEMDGFDTAMAIRREQPDRPIPIVFVTSYGSTKDKLARAYSVGASDLLEKPIDGAALRAKVRTVVDMWHRLQAAEARHREEIFAARLQWETEQRVRQETASLRRRADDQENVAAAEHQARVEAEDANRLKDEFLATLSHELRTPLNAILGWTAILGRRPSDPAAVVKAVEVIDRNARAQAKLIDDMLDVSRVIAGKLRLEARPVLVSPLVERAVESFRPAAEKKQLALTLHAGGHVAPVSGDPDRLQQVVGNLISNAVKFTTGPGRIDVTVEGDLARTRIRVADTGQGIAPEFLPYVFDRFRQGDAAATRMHGGLGIGLSLARHLVELHGGTIGVESAGAGRGATFTVDLPAVAPGVVEQSAAPGTPARALASLDSVRVLVVDDDRDARELVREVMEEAGATVKAVATARLALDALMPFNPHVIVSDIGMPEMDGYTLLQTIRGEPPERGGTIPAVALTAYASPEDIERARHAGFQAFLRKPVDAGNLVAEVAALAPIHRWLAQRT